MPQVRADDSGVDSMTYRESEFLKTFRRVSIAAVIGVLVLLGLIIISQILGGSNFSTWSTRLIALLGLLICYLTVLLAASTSQRQYMSGSKVVLTWKIEASLTLRVKER